jgi:hypothetical protein
VEQHHNHHLKNNTMQTAKQQPQQKTNLIERIGVLFTQKLVTTPFPVQILSQLWTGAACRALDLASPAGMGISHIDLASLHRIDWCNLQINYNQFAALSNNLDTRSAQDLNLSGTEYADLLIEANAHIEFFAEETGKMRKECEEILAAEGLATKPTGAFNVVKGEA